MVEQWLTVSDIDIVPSWVDTFNYMAVEAIILGELGLKFDKVGSTAIIEKARIRVMEKMRCYYFEE